MKNSSKGSPVGGKGRGKRGTRGSAPSNPSDGRTTSSAGQTQPVATSEESLATPAPGSVIPTAGPGNDTVATTESSSDDVVASTGTFPGDNADPVGPNQTGNASPNDDDALDSPTNDSEISDHQSPPVTPSHSPRQPPAFNPCDDPDHTTLHADFVRVDKEADDLHAESARHQDSIQDWTDYSKDLEDERLWARRILVRLHDVKDGKEDVPVAKWPEHVNDQRTTDLATEELVDHFIDNARLLTEARREIDKLNSRIVVMDDEGGYTYLDENDPPGVPDGFQALSVGDLVVRTNALLFRDRDRQKQDRTTGHCSVREHGNLQQERDDARTAKHAADHKFDEVQSDLDNAIKERDDAKLRHEEEEHARKAADDQLRTVSRDLKATKSELKMANEGGRIPPAYLIAMQEMEKERKAAADDVKTLQTQLSESQQRHLNPTGCFDPTRRYLQHELNMLKKKYDDLERALAERPNSTVSPGECNIPGHDNALKIRDLQGELDKVRQELGRADVRRNSRACTIPEHQGLEEERDTFKAERDTLNDERNGLISSRDDLQIDYNRVYDYAYDLQEAAVAYLNHQDVKPRGTGDVGETF